MNSYDVFGNAFSDYLNGETTGTIVVNVDISGEEELPVSYFFRSYDEMPEWEQLVLDTCSGKVLDVGAGAGSHALYLQERGLQVTALDHSSGAVECMKKRGLTHVVQEDFFAFGQGKFDTILFLMNGAGMAATIDNLSRLLVHALELLSAGGSIFIESTDILYMYTDEDGTAMIDLAGNYYGEVEYTLGYKHYQDQPFPWLFIDFENLSEIAGQCGLDCTLLYEGETSNYVACLKHAGTTKQE